MTYFINPDTVQARLEELEKRVSAQDLLIKSLQERLRKEVPKTPLPKTEAKEVPDDLGEFYRKTRKGVFEGLREKD